MPKISVIIPIYNVDKYLEQCLNSVLNQTLQDYEILCINDGSTDNSSKILEKYINKDNRIKNFNTENKGAGAARNIGLKNAQGEYIAFLDGDDFYNTNYLEKMYNISKQNDCDITICVANRYDTNTKTYSKINYSLKENFLPNKAIFSYKDIPDKIFNIAQNWNWNKLFKHEFVKNNNLHFQEIYRTNDLFFTCTALVLAKKITTIKEALVNYRIGMNKNSQNTNYLYPLDFYKAFTKLYEFLIEKNIYEEVKKSYLSWTLEGCLYNIKSIPDQNIQKQIYDKILKDGNTELGLEYIINNIDIEPELYNEYLKIKNYSLFL